MNNQKPVVPKEKITIRLDEDILERFRKASELTGAPYQTLINRTLRHALENNKNWPLNLIKE